MALLTTAQTQEPMLGFTAIESSKAEADKPKDISKKPEAKKPEAKKPSAELEKAQAQVKQLQEQMKKLHEQMRATAAKLQVAHRELLKFGGHPGAKEGHHPGAWLGFLFHGMSGPHGWHHHGCPWGITVSAAGQEDGTTTEASQGITVSAAGQEDGTTIEASQGITVLAADSGTCRTTLSWRHSGPGNWAGEWPHHVAWRHSGPGDSSHGAWRHHEGTGSLDLERKVDRLNREVEKLQRELHEKK